MDLIGQRFTPQDVNHPTLLVCAGQGEGMGQSIKERSKRFSWEGRHPDWDQRKKGLIKLPVTTIAEKKTDESKKI